MEDFWIRYINEDKSITPKNKNGEPHGHWFAYNNNDFWFECHYVNGKELGYEKWRDEQKFYHAL
jgi:hypothetical protein